MDSSSLSQQSSVSIFNKTYSKCHTNLGLTKSAKLMHQIITIAVPYIFIVTQTSLLICLPLVSRCVYNAVKPFCLYIKKSTKYPIYYDTVILGDYDVELINRFKIYFYVFPKAKADDRLFVRTLVSHLIYSNYNAGNMMDVIKDFIHDIINSTIHGYFLRKANIHRFRRLLIKAQEMGIDIKTSVCNIFDYPFAPHCPHCPHWVTFLYRVASTIWHDVADKCKCGTMLGFVLNMVENDATNGVPIELIGDWGCTGKSEYVVFFSDSYETRMVLIV